jgi:three-Cys-motif partner protein
MAARAPADAGQFTDGHVTHDGPGGTAVRNVGPQALDKWRLTDRITNITSKGIKAKFRNRVYLEPFAGTGLCRLKTTGELVDGSALRALTTRPDYTHFAFGDINPDALGALRYHAERRAPRGQVEYFQGDCTQTAGQMGAWLRGLPGSTLTTAFIDPTFLQWPFRCTRDVALGNRVDLLIHVPMGEIKRVLHLDLPALYEFFGDEAGGTTWRDVYRRAKFKLGDEANVTRALLDHYKFRLSELGYHGTSDQDEALIRVPSRNIPLYYLVYASRHPLGKRFWDSIRGISQDGTMRMLPGFASLGAVEHPTPWRTPKTRFHS